MKWDPLRRKDYRRLVFASETRMWTVVALRGVLIAGFTGAVMGLVHRTTLCRPRSGSDPQFG